MNKAALALWLSWLECCPVRGLIPCHGTYRTSVAGLGLSWDTYGRQPINVSLSQINENISSGEDLKKKKKNPTNISEHLSIYIDQALCQGLAYLHRARKLAQLDTAGYVCTE